MIGWNYVFFNCKFFELVIKITLWIIKIDYGAKPFVKTSSAINFLLYGNKGIQ